MLVPYNDPDLLSSTGTAADSPYVIAMKRAGIKVLPHIINACIFTSAFSAGNSFLFSSSRVLYGLALRGQAPRIFAYCTKGGLPIFAVLLTGAFGFLAFMNVSSGAVTVFNWLVNLSTVGGFFGWWGMNVTYVFFCTSFSSSCPLRSSSRRGIADRGMKAQGFDRRKLSYNSGLQPWLSYWGIFWTTLFILINGYAVFWDFNASGFLTACGSFLLFLPRVSLLTRTRRHQHPSLLRAVLRLEDHQAHENLETSRNGLRHRHPHSRGDGDTRGATKEPRGEDLQHRVLDVLQCAHARCFVGCMDWVSCRINSLFSSIVCNFLYSYRHAYPVNEMFKRLVSHLYLSLETVIALRLLIE